MIEVKLSTNPELKDRRVIAQVVDYAASFSQLEMPQLLDLFTESGQAKSWEDLIVDRFPDEDDPAEIADVLHHRARDLVDRAVGDVGRADERSRSPSDEAGTSPSQTTAAPTAGAATEGCACSASSSSTLGAWFLGLPLLVVARRRRG